MRRNDVLTAVAFQLQLHGPATIFDLGVKIEEATLGQVGDAVGWLVEKGFVKPEVASSSVIPTYKLAYQAAVSDLDAKLNPPRDPVREAHEWEQGHEPQARKRKDSQHGADLDLES